MDIQTYRKEKGLSQAAFAALLTEHGQPATQSLVAHWEVGRVKITPARAQQIRDATGGDITRSDLRPDIWPPADAAA